MSPYRKVSAKMSRVPSKELKAKMTRRQMTKRPIVVKKKERKSRKHRKPHALTDRRKKLIVEFLKRASSHPEKYGDFGTERWTTSLTRYLRLELRENYIVPGDVKVWMTTTNFFQETISQLESIGNSSNSESGTSSPSSPFLGRETRKSSKSAIPIQQSSLEIEECSTHSKAQENVSSKAKSQGSQKLEKRKLTSIDISSSDDEDYNVPDERSTHVDFSDCSDVSTDEEFDSHPPCPPPTTILEVLKSLGSKDGGKAPTGLQDVADNLRIMTTASKAALKHSELATSRLKELDNLLGKVAPYFDL